MNTLADPALTVIGSINLDITAHTQRLPTAGETVGEGRLTRQPGGKGANQAVAAARLAGNSRMIGAVGADDDGRRLLESMTAAGVNTTDVVPCGEPTGTALIVVDSDGENQIAVCPGANRHIDLKGIDFGPEETILCQLEVDFDIVLEAARRAPGFFALNAAPARSLPPELIQRCDLIIVNESEYNLIPELVNAKLVAVTYGGDGASIIEHGQLTARVPAVKADVINSVGAGDAFCAALVLSLRSGVGHEDALAAACAVGADAVSDQASQPQLAPLGQYMKSSARN